MFRQPTKVCTADYDSGVQYFIFAVLSEEARRLILVESAYNLRYAASTCICAARCLVLAVSAYTTLAGVVSERARCLSIPVSCPSAQDVWAARRPTLSGVQDCIKYVVFATMSEQPNVLSLPCPAITLVCRIASTCCLRHPGHLPGLDAYTYALRCPATAEKLMYAPWFPGQNCVGPASFDNGLCKARPSKPRSAVG